MPWFFTLELDGKKAQLIGPYGTEAEADAAHASAVENEPPETVIGDVFEESMSYVATFPHPVALQTQDGVEVTVWSDGDVIPLS